MPESAAVRPATGTREPAARTGRVAALDGVRGVAVILVVIGHVTGTFAPYAANVGVTLFFVLSGYLITSLLLKERERAGRLRMGAFYMRRVLRLYPALLLLLLVGPLVMAVAHDPQLPTYPTRAIAAALYLTDFVEASGTDLAYLTHTWSLSVEEQFYIVWPWLLLAALAVTAGRLPRRALPLIVGVLTAAGLAWRIAGAVLFPGDRSYFAPDMNAFILLLGCLLAVLPPAVVARVPRSAAVAALLAAIVGSFALPGGSPQLRDWVVIGSALLGAVVVAGFAGGGRLLSWSPLVWFGGVSYGLYLWHDFLLHVLWGGREAGGLLRVALVVASVAIAWASFRFVETPLLRLKRRWEPLRVVPGDEARVLAPGTAAV